MENKFRHEYKYMIDAAQQVILKQRCQGLLFRDIHAGQDGTYQIQSLYFDDSSNRCYFENENGVDPRAKYRIRYYNQDTAHLKLEKKSKVHGMTRKESCHLTPQECKILMEGGMVTVTPDMEPIKKRLLTELRLLALQPKVIVTYRRTPFVYQAGNVRITFDERITSSTKIGQFLETSRIERPILPTGASVLEVKWDELLPEYMKNYLALETLQWSNFSKYYLCRKYSV